MELVWMDGRVEGLKEGLGWWFVGEGEVGGDYWSWFKFVDFVLMCAQGD